MTVRRIALGLVVVALVAVSALGVVAAVVERRGGGPADRSATARSTAADPAGAADAVPPGGPTGRVAAIVSDDWQRIASGAVTYAVPPEWSRRRVTERVAYREDGVVISSGRGYAQHSVGGCPVAWSVLADPVQSTNAPGVARATALAWARGYAGLPSGTPLEAAVGAGVMGGADASLAGATARVEVPLGDAAGCAGERAELTALATRSGDAVVVLVVARYLSVPGAPTNAAYAGVLGSLRVH